MEVINDLYTLLGSDTEIQNLMGEHLIKHNRKYLQEYETPESGKLIFTEASELKKNRIYDPRTHKSYLANHENLTAYDPRPCSSKQEDSQLKELLEGVKKYVEEHYPKGFGTVLPSSSSGAYEIILVSSKYNPGNFCNARWCSQWTWNTSTSQLSGIIKGTVHFFEEGNVQLSLNHNSETESDTKLTPASVFKAIEKSESQYQTDINRFYSELDQTGFRNLRRALPVTKTKMDWEKIDNYRISAALTDK